MYLHHGYRSKDSQRSSKFTAHAAAQLQRRHNNSTSGRYDGAAAGQLLDDLGHKDSTQLKRLVHETFPTCNVNQVQVVNDPQMYGMYLLRKEETRVIHGGHGDNELILYHVTTKSRALESLKSGLDWRRTWRSKFGRGVSFSDDADYANYYADHSPKEDIRVIIVCAVLVNKTQRVSGNRNDGNLIVPKGSADTTVSSNGRVYVKYNDYEFYPLYLMYYQRTPEHLNESKYFRNNPNNKWQQNNRAVRQQQQESKAQREREQAQQQQLELERAQQQREREHEQWKRDLQAQRKREREQMAWRHQELQERRREEQLIWQEQQLEEHRRAEQYSRQAQARQRESNNCLIL